MSARNKGSEVVLKKGVLVRRHASFFLRREAVKHSKTYRAGKDTLDCMVLQRTHDKSKTKPTGIEKQNQGLLIELPKY
ncbi:hypothetical protein [Holospora curviuscula]|uniref:Uncharacterized protein n=1 Tax=Holospora curviuscula TaxID=1082868 RepID=A0A2S5R7P8_9PROT|nr:hypothetical protein [Holospora curviuscula]PPE03369.1 hypothetical protein HCUR_01202 [Holospora curviuscula]